MHYQKFDCFYLICKVGIPKHQNHSSRLFLRSKFENKSFSSIMVIDAISENLKFVSNVLYVLKQCD